MCYYALADSLSWYRKWFLVWQDPPRTLNQHELATLKRIYGDSLNLRNIRVVDGRAGLFSINNRPFVLGNVIYMKGQGTRTFVHESVHVWQYQHEGARYIGLALAAEFGQRWCGGVSYNWEHEIARGNGEWKNFNKEAQASFVEDLYAHGAVLINGIHSARPGDFFDADNPDKVFVFNQCDHTARALEAVSVIRRLTTAARGALT